MALRIMFRFPSKAFTGRELAKQVPEVSHMAVSKSVKSLIAMNLISQEYHGRSQLLSLNKSSYLFSILKELFNHEEETTSHLAAEIKGFFKDNEIKKRGIRSIVLFGSVAKRKESINSDIDLLIIAKSRKKTEEELSELQDRISKEFGNVISPYFMEPGEFKRKEKTPFIKDIKKNYILILGEDIK